MLKRDVTDFVEHDRFELGEVEVSQGRASKEKAGFENAFALGEAGHPGVVPVGMGRIDDEQAGFRDPSLGETSSEKPEEFGVFYRGASH